MKKLFIKTYGCQMNVYDSARMAELLAGIGYAPTDGVEDADMVILNTCHIREKATEKIYSELGRLKRLKDRKAEEGSPMLIAVAGCVAQAQGKEILARQQAVDLVVGPQSYHRLPEMIARAARGAGHVLETDFPADEKFDALPGERGSEGPAAFLTVQEGCDKFCTFCVVPYTRGNEYSRPVEQIVAEAKALVARGVREITLLGQNVNAYRGVGVDGENWSLAQLLYRLAEIDGLARLRYTTSHPRDMGDDLIEAHGQLDQLMPYLHLPVQSGSDRVLAAMNRQHKREMYFRLVDRLRATRPDLALSSDFIVGFPGETDEDFEATLSLVRGRRLRERLLVQIQRASGNAGGGTGQTSARRGEDCAARGIADAADRTTDGVQRQLRETCHACAVRKAGTQTRSGHRPQPLSAVRPCRKRVQLHRRNP